MQEEHRTTKEEYKRNTGQQRRKTRRTQDNKSGTQEEHRTTKEEYKRNTAPQIRMQEEHRTTKEERKRNTAPKRRNTRGTQDNKGGTQG